MGWTSMPPPAEGAPAYLDRHCYSYETPTRRLLVLRSAMVGTTYYAACRLTDKVTGAVTVFAGVALTSRRSDPDGYNFAYKEMTEDEGPNEARCPKAILDLLTAPGNDHARDWRARCREHLATSAATRAKPALLDGHTIRFATPITFSDGAVLDTFTVVDRPGARPRLAFRADSGGLYRISNARARDYTIVTKTA